MPPELVNAQTCVIFECDSRLGVASVLREAVEWLESLDVPGGLTQGQPLRMVGGLEVEVDTNRLLYQLVLYFEDDGEYGRRAAEENRNAE